MTQNEFNTSCSKCKNTQCLIKLCDDKWIALLNDKNIQMLYHKGRYIFSEGNPVFGGYFIQEGKVKITSSNYDGKKQIVRLATDGHILGHRGFSGETYPIDAIAMEDSIICFFDNQTLYEAFMANPEFSFEGMMFYSKELRKSEERSKLFAQMTMDEKIIFTLLYIASTFGLSRKEKALNVPLSRQEIADIAGTTSEQVSRSISILSHRNFIKTVGKKILLVNQEAMIKSIAQYKVGAL